MIVPGGVPVRGLLMRHEPTTVLIFGHDKSLLETRQWVLQTRGYKVIVVQDLGAIESLPSTRRVDLLLICHSVAAAEREVAIAKVGRRWPGVRHLALRASEGRMPNGILG